MERTERQERLAGYHKEEADKVIEAFGKLVNHGGDAARFAIADAFAKEHRTLQQAIWGCIQQIILDLSEKELLGHVDARNEYAAAQARNIVRVFGTSHPEPIVDPRVSRLDGVPLI